MTPDELLQRIEAWGVVLVVGYGDRVEFSGDSSDPPEARLPVLKTLEYLAPDGVMTEVRLAWLRRHKQALIAAVAARDRAERATWTTPQTRSTPVVYTGEPCLVKSHQHHKPEATQGQYFFPSGVCVEAWRRRDVKGKGKAPDAQVLGEDAGDRTDSDTMPRLEGAY
jgi:hypothetical protein